MNRTNFDYRHVNRKKNFSVIWTIGLAILAIAFALLRYTPINALIAAKFFPSRSLLVAVKALARENYARLAYATAVRVDETIDFKGCESDYSGFLGPGKKPSDIAASTIVNPVPTFTEFIVSERRQTVCVVVSEIPEPSLLKNVEPFNVRRSQSHYAAIFGNLPEVATLKLASDVFDLSKARLELLSQSPETMPKDFKQFYRRVPRAYPLSRQEEGAKMLANPEEFFSVYLKIVQKELGSPPDWLNKTMAMAALMSAAAFVLFVYVPIYKAYSAFCHEMQLQGFSAPSHCEFIFAEDVIELRDRLILRKRKILRRENGDREQNRLANRQREQKTREEKTAAPVQKTREEIYQDHQKTIARMCQELRGHTPENNIARKETEGICFHATILLDFNVARELLTNAIRERKAANEREKNALAKAAGSK